MTEEMRIDFDQMIRLGGSLNLNRSFRSYNFRNFEAHEYHRKMQRQLRNFRPVLAQIFEKDSDHSISAENMKRPDMRFYKMFTSRTNGKTERLDPIAEKNRALCDAAFDESIVKVKYLIKRGASPNCYDTHQRTPLHIAVSKGNRSLVRMLLSRGADPNLKDGVGNSCLHLAACTLDFDMCLLLTERGAKVDVLDIRGRSPIDLARSKLRMLPDTLTTNKFEEINNIMLLLVTKQRAEKSGHTALLESCHNRLQVASNPAEISHELNSLDKILDQMESLTIDGK